MNILLQNLLLVFLPPIPPKGGLNSIYDSTMEELYKPGLKSHKCLKKKKTAPPWGGWGVISPGNFRKTLSILSLLFMVISLLSSCHRNRLKTNEKELAKEIVLQEKQKEETDKAAHDEEMADTLDRSKKGLLFKEDRSVDPLHPPVIIDIASNFNNIKEFKLTDIFSEIKYVRLETVPDSTFKRAMKFKYYLIQDYIIATNPSGILLYSKDGKFLNTIVKNKTTGINVDSTMMQVIGTNTFIGGGTSVWNMDDKLYYTYRNSISGQEYIMEYDLSKNQIVPTKKFESENPDQIIGLGEVAFDMNPSKKKDVWKYKLAPELVMWGISFEYIYQSTGTFIIDKNTYAKELKRTDKIAVINDRGDTITTFSGFEEGNSLRFEYDGKQFLWNYLNDTVFQVAGSNRIIPVSILNMGQYKAPLEQVQKIGSDLTGKIILRSWAQNKDFIFLTLCKDTYDSPNSRKSKKVKIYHALFSKQNHNLFIVKGNPLDYSPEILENDLDGGFPVWPLQYMISNNGEIMVSLKGNDLKKRVLSEEFRNSKAPVLKKKELERLAASVSKNEDILMLIR
jgi:hypothetical protein